MTIAEHPLITVTTGEAGIEISTPDGGVLVPWSEMTGLVAELIGAMAGRFTKEFSEATRAAVERHHAAGVHTVGVDQHGRIISQAPDGTRTESFSCAAVRAI